ncbi:MAG: hypothetical protein R3D82_19775 [Xanthobacteraceae bacterium]|nr:hypothetical protein [Bradyrhizobium sp.]
MNAIAVSKSRMQNWLEGVTLTGLFHGLPTFVAAAMLLKLFSTSELVRDHGGVLIFVFMATVLHAVVTPWLAPKFPKLFQHNYEPLFFDAGLSFAEKIARWRTRPATSRRLMANVLMLSLLAVAVMTVG